MNRIKIFLHSFIEFVYRLLGPKIGFSLAMSPFGKFIFFASTATIKGNVVFQTRYGFTFEASKHDYYYSGFFFLGLTNPLETKIFEQLISKNTVVFDIGAESGWYSLVAASKLGSKGKVYSFEPNPKCFALLKRNIKHNVFRSITVESLALSDKEGKSTFYTGDEMGGSFIKDNTDRLTFNKKSIQKITVQTTCLDRYIKENRISRCDILKIDVEGAEYQVLKGAKHTLQHHKPIIFIEYIEESLQSGGTSKIEITKYLRKFGYTPYKFTSTGIEELQQHDEDLQVSNIIFTCRPLAVGN